MRSHLLIFLVIFVCNCSYSQTWNEGNAKLVGGPCEGCEAIFEYGNKSLNNVDTLPDFNMGKIKLKVMGTIYQADGSTPASGVILYVYQTDQYGIYTTKGGETGWAKRHGYIRGWIKTNEDGKYTFYTLKPGAYPGRTTPAHIHPIILAPNGQYYWLGAYHFAGDELLTEKEISPYLPRGGSSGLLELKKEGNLYVGKRDFILGKNIAGYDN